MSEPQLLTLQEDSWTYVDDEIALNHAITTLAHGDGPVGVDVERASGFKYFQRAYLVQIYRRNSGTFLIDPTAFNNLDKLGQALADEEWVLHAAIADLESLSELGLKPKKLFDTELASRLLGFDRVGLGSITEQLLSTKLEKAYSRADWSTRPLPAPWLEYAALDVVLLPDLRDAIYDLLVSEDKLRFAEQEFEALLNQQPKESSSQPWRKLSGFGKLRDPKLITMAQQLWLARDEFAREQDIAPARVLPNASIMTAVMMDPRSANQLARNRDFKGIYSRVELDRWWRAILKAKVTAPPPRDTFDKDHAPSNVRSWERKNPDAHKRLQAARELLKSEAERLKIPQENLLSPAVVKAISWDPPAEITAETIALSMQHEGARPWQRELSAQLLADIFVDTL